jgi:hypothetical protein
MTVVSHEQNKLHTVNGACPIYVKGKWFTSAYHLFVYVSLTEGQHREVVLRMQDQGKIWWALNKANFPLVDNWLEVREKLMTKCLKVKYEQNPLLLAHLKSLGAVDVKAPAQLEWYDFSNRLELIARGVPNLNHIEIF